MNKNVSALVASAVAALVCAAPLTSCKSESSKSGGSSATSMEKHSCAGKNSCKGMGGCGKSPNTNGCKGKNTCKGHGGCATDKNSCKGNNGCKG